jgi:protoheme IX farnesyltransferase
MVVTTRAVTAPGLASRMAMLLADYVRLTKPRVISLLLLTTLLAMIMAEGGWPSGATVLWTMIGGYLAAGGANAINQWFDRDIDARMRRTASRPIVAGRVGPAHALVYALTISVASALILGFGVNWLTAGLAMLGSVLYVFLYTWWLKRATTQNIVIGGAAGAVPPLVGWAAAEGSIGLGALILFAIVFYWTPPHFWALALLLRKDYAEVGVPMLPVVRGVEETARQVLLWTVVLVGVTLLPVAAGISGAFYLTSAAVLGALFLMSAWQLTRRPDERRARSTFSFSMLYLALLFAALATDAVL